MAIPEIFTKPEFYDWFGLPIFIFILWLSYTLLKTKKKPKKWMLLLLMGIGIAGVIVDGTIVIYTNKLLSLIN